MFYEVDGVGAVRENVWSTQSIEECMNRSCLRKNRSGFNAGSLEFSGIGLASQTHGLVALPPLPAVRTLFVLGENRDLLVQLARLNLAMPAAKDFRRICDRDDTSKSVTKQSDQGDQARTVGRCGRHDSGHRQ